jgi:hypothetical protein
MSGVDAAALLLRCLAGQLPKHRQTLDAAGLDIAAFQFDMLDMLLLGAPVQQSVCPQ